MSLFAALASPVASPSRRLWAAYVAGMYVFAGWSLKSAARAPLPQSVPPLSTTEQLTLRTGLFCRRVVMAPVWPAALALEALWQTAYQCSSPVDDDFE